jgi:glutamyl-Q tRNA(Asp) synthetase
MSGSYVGRFAPSPTGPLHAGSLVAALGSWLDARTHGGQWLVRIEDTDTPRCSEQAAHTLLQQLERCGLQPDGEVVWQSTRSAHYEAAWQRLVDAGHAYPCGCTRSQIDAWWQARGQAPVRDRETPYPGLCRKALQGSPRAWRLRCGEWPDALHISWSDRRLGAQQQDLTREVGDFVLKRADGLWAYQLAVVVDDALQGVSDVVRGADLADNTPRQIHLQRLLGLPTPRYLHLPLVLAPTGQKLSKQSGAPALDLHDTAAVLRELHTAARHLGLELDNRPPPSTHQGHASALQDFQAQALNAWSGRNLRT